ncbi:MAG: hypothetical protein Q8S73_10575 [Deltaproteobacteria bacterium]|nr:hypothetical protein [Myxococcales bacterium]MDP3214538.1 hypothetical protein [Deltaproteobacteria bacterium]
MYVESNFLVGIVLGQEHSKECGELLDLAKASRIELVLPAFAIVEPMETLRRRREDLDDYGKRSKKWVRELARMKAANLPEGIASELERAINDATNSIFVHLVDLRSQLFAHGRILALDVATLKKSQDLRDQAVLKDEKDAIMLAAVMLDLASAPAPSIFVNLNSNDFATPEVESLLGPLQCIVFSKPKDALRRIGAGPPTPPAG